MISNASINSSKMGQASNSSTFFRKLEGFLTNINEDKDVSTYKSAHGSKFRLTQENKEILV